MVAMVDIMQAGQLARRIRVKGRVQGVGYRFWVEHEAAARGLDGWVRNRLDGSVEILVVGAATQVEDFIASCHNGPARALVEHVDVEETPGIVAAGFSRKPTV